ncbi:hypothetical protein HDV00_000186 [Rhizophlyctis rosea]|nr:hypothetical protein HDV00_000186 [Rhizophlyctis rosea]
MSEEPALTSENAPSPSFAPPTDIPNSESLQERSLEESREETNNTAPSTSESLQSHPADIDGRLKNGAQDWESEEEAEANGDGEEEEDEGGYMPLDNDYTALPDDTEDESHSDTPQGNSGFEAVFSRPLPEAHIPPDDLELIRSVMAAMSIPDSAVPGIETDSMENSKTF